MIKARANGLLLFGLSRGNIEKLMENYPIRIKGSDIGIRDDIIIFFGETEEAMAIDLSKLFNDETKITDQRPH